MKLIVAAALILLRSASCIARDEVYVNPADGKAYVAPGGWQKYSPEQPAQPTDKKVTLGGARLLQSQEEIASRTTVEDMKKLIDAARDAASEVFANYVGSAVLLVQLTSLPGRTTAEIASQGDPPAELLQRYYGKLQGIKPLATSGEVKFQITLNVKP